MRKCHQLLEFRPQTPIGELPLDPAMEDFRPSDPLIAHPWKNPAGAHDFGHNVIAFRLCD